MVIKCIRKKCLLKMLEMESMAMTIFKSVDDIKSKLNIISKN